ncbi:HAMP domain-containing sensor histidine kinase [Gammaproteobacteria bacterium]|nr:HAMP domain-containing sensor histidine kinase [Gammaproteobacteria bacterium]
MTEGLARAWRWLRFSLSARLLLLFFIATVVLVIGIGNLLKVNIGDAFREQERRHLDQYLFYTFRELGFPPSIIKARELSERLPVEIALIGPDLDWRSDGMRDRWLLLAKRPPSEWKSRNRRSDHHSDRWDRLMHDWNDRFEGPPPRVSSGWHRGLWSLIAQRGPYRIVVVSAPDDHGEAIFRLIVGVLLMIALVMALVYLSTRWLFRPIVDIRRTVLAIGDGELDRRVVIRQHDELGELGESVNAMAMRIQHMLEAKRDLLLAISHELRTPLTRARLGLAMLKDRSRRETIEEDIREVEALLAQLIEAERLGDRHVVLNRQCVDLRELLADECESDEERPVAIVDVPDEAQALVDEARVRLMLRNLVDNARRHNDFSAGPIEVALSQTGDHWCFTVRDYGEGIVDDAVLARLGEAFFRPDASRQKTDRWHWAWAVFVASRRRGSRWPLELCPPFATRLGC